VVTRNVAVVAVSDVFSQRTAVAEVGRVGVGGADGEEGEGEQGDEGVPERAKGRHYFAPSFDVARRSVPVPFSSRRFDAVREAVPFAPSNSMLPSAITSWSD